APAGMVTVLGRGFGRLCSPSAPLDAGNSGTTMRLMAGVLAGHPFSSTMVGDASLSRRPMRRVIAPLEQMGARIESVDGHAPLTIEGSALHAIAHEPSVPSAQVKSAVLLAGLHADGTTRVTEPASTRDHTERAVRAFGGEVASDGLTVSIRGGQRLAGQSLTVPGDFSSAAFWLAAAAELRVKESDRIAALVAGFRALGIDADERPDGFVVRGPSSTRPTGGVADARGDHRMAMAFAIAALGAERSSTILGADAVVISYPGFFETLDRLVAPLAGIGEL